MRFGNQRKLIKDPDIVRFHFRLINRDGFTTTSNVQLKDASFNLSLNNILINETEKFFIEVEKYKVPGTYLPVQIFRIQEGIVQSNTNLGAYIVTLSLAGQDVSVALIFIPDDKTIPAPPPPSLSGGFQVKSEYYFIFTYNNFLALLNTALATAFAGLIGAHPNSTRSPQFSYDGSTKLFSFIVEDGYNTDGLEIFFNSNLYDLFTTFNSFKVKFPLDIKPENVNKNYQILTRFNGQNVTEFIPPGGPPNTTDFLKITQNQPSIESWDSVSRIILETNLPVDNEYIAGNEPTFEIGILQAETILADSIILRLDQGIRGYITFIQQTKRINGLGSKSIQSISLNARWFDRKGEDFPIRIGPYQEIMVTIVFSSKSLRKNLTVNDLIETELELAQMQIEQS